MLGITIPNDIKNVLKQCYIKYNKLQDSVQKESSFRDSSNTSKDEKYNLWEILSIHKENIQNDLVFKRKQKDNGIVTKHYF